MVRRKNEPIPIELMRHYENAVDFHYDVESFYPQVPIGTNGWTTRGLYRVYENEDFILIESTRVSAWYGHFRHTLTQRKMDALARRRCPSARIYREEDRQLSNPLHDLFRRLYYKKGDKS